MKKSLILFLCVLSLGVRAQFTYPNMNVTNLLGIPQSASPSIGSASNAIKYLVYNTTTGTVQVYNGTSFANVGSGGSGTVTSVALSVPTGLSISGTPITTSGTLALSLQSGYSIPTTAKQTSWDAKLDAVTGTTTNSQMYVKRANGTQAMFDVVEPSFEFIYSSPAFGGSFQAKAFDKTTLSAFDSSVPSSKAVKDYADTKQSVITLTTTGTSGSATFTSGTLNIPIYSVNSPFTQTGSQINPTIANSQIVNTGNIPGNMLTISNTNTSAGIGISSSTDNGVALNGVSSTGIAGQFSSGVASGGNPTVKISNTSTGDLVVFQGSGSGSAKVFNNGDIRYGTDISASQVDRSLPDLGTVKKLTSAYPYLSKTASYTVLLADWVNTNTLTIIVDATAGNVTITLPTASTVAGKIIMVKRMDNTANTLTVSGGGTNIDGTSTVSVSMQYGNAMIQSISTQYITL